MKRNQQPSPVCRHYGEVRAFADDVETTRTVEFVISNAARDRHRTVLNPAGWDLRNYERNGIVGYQHNVYGGDMCVPDNPDNVIGRGSAYLEGDNLIGRVTFEPADLNPLAEKVFRKVLFGSLRATSVGFQPLGTGKWGEGEEAKGQARETYYFAGQELLEWSIVNIPSNPTAAGRAMRDQASNALMYIKRTLGDDYSFTDIEKMTVADVLRLLETAKHRGFELVEEESETPPLVTSTRAHYERTLSLL